jgi:hypothetical protein
MHQLHINNHKLIISMKSKTYSSPQVEIAELCFESSVLMTSYGDDGKPSTDIYFDDDNAPII